MVPQTDPRVEGLVGAQVLVEPLGMVRVMQWLHRGRLFDVFEGEYAGQAVCLKTPVLKSADPVDADEHAFSDLVHSDQTNVFTTRKGCTAVVAADPALQSRLLTVEAQRIRDTQGRWNHEVLALGVWDPTGYVEPGPFDLATAMDRYRPVLVTPRHLGQTLDQLDRATQRRLFPRMLPALWDALAFAPHGDLSPCNLVWDRHNDRFALIDPGVALTSERKRRGPKSLDEGLTVMTTNAVHYPLICPIGDLSAEFSSSLEGGWGLFRFEMMGLRKPSEGMFSYERGSGQPSYADLQALGVMTFGILTGQHPLYGTVKGWEQRRPIWLRSSSHRDIGREPSDPRWRSLAEIVEGAGFVAPSQLDRSVTPAEDVMCRVLLELRLSGRAHVVALARDVIAAMPQESLP